VLTATQQCERYVNTTRGARSERQAAATGDGGRLRFTNKGKEKADGSEGKEEESGWW